jgi:aldose 1-epimerase
MAVLTSRRTMSGPPSGEQYVLTHGEQRAVVVELGGGLRSYRAGDVEVIDGYRRNEACDGARGQLLLPWPNRIAGATYPWNGHTMQIPVNEPRTGSAIHGLSRSMRWHRVDGALDSLTLSLDLTPQDGYPFALGLTAEYILETRGLRVRVTAVNRGDQPCPYGAGAHPYVCVMGSAVIDDALLHLPADATLEADNRGIPTGILLPVEGTAFDFRAPRRIGNLVLDTAFTQLHPDADGVTRISLTSADRHHGVGVWMDGTHRYTMIYSGDTLADTARRRASLAIEPMTCAPDAFNSGAGLITLQPGQEHSSVWGITPHGMKHW